VRFGVARSKMDGGAKRSVSTSGAEPAAILSDGLAQGLSLIT